MCVGESGERVGRGWGGLVRIGCIFAPVAVPYMVAHVDVGGCMCVCVFVC